VLKRAEIIFWARHITLDLIGLSLALSGNKNSSWDEIANVNDDIAHVLQDTKQENLSLLRLTN